ncbi:MAG: hypothetical protein EOP04_04470, partial [Proteobacteria bacterium]
MLKKLFIANFLLANFAHGQVQPIASEEFWWHEEVPAPWFVRDGDYLGECVESYSFTSVGNEPIYSSTRAEYSILGAQLTVAQTRYQGKGCAKSLSYQRDTAGLTLARKIFYKFLDQDFIQYVASEDSRTEEKALRINQSEADLLNKYKVFSVHWEAEQLNVISGFTAEDFENSLALSPPSTDGFDSDAMRLSMIRNKFFAFN